MIGFASIPIFGCARKTIKETQTPQIPFSALLQRSPNIYIYGVHDKCAKKPAIEIAFSQSASSKVYTDNFSYSHGSKNEKAGP